MNDSRSFDSSAPITAGWSAKRICIGRIVIEEVTVSTAEGASYLNNALTTIFERTRRRHPGRQSRFAEPLPACTPGRLLSAEAADFLVDMQRRGLSRAALDAQKRVFRLLMLAAGDIPVGEINAGHIRKYWDVVRWWPSNVGSTKKYAGMSDEAILEEGKRTNRPPPARQTIEGAKRFIAVFFNRLLRMRVIAYSPLEAFGEIKDDLVENETRRPFSTEELRKIFDENVFVPWAKESPHRWWAPMLGLYTGARAGEIGQLKVADVICDQGVWCIAIRKTADEDLGPNAGMRSRQSLKGKTSRRVIPIAQPLIDAGFLDFVEDAKQVKHARLFPHLVSGTDKKTGEPNGRGYGMALSFQFSSYLKAEQDMEKGMAFHAFRHLFVTLMEEAGVSKELTATMTGHAVRKNVPVLERYLHLRPELLRQRQTEALSMFNPGVELPKYRRGQFAKSYGADARMYP